MKVLLINPPFTRYGGLEGHGGKMTPINLGYLAAYAREKKKNYAISILDAEVLGMTFEDIGSHIRKEKPDVVGITSSTPAYSSVVQIATICKSFSEDIKVVIGGVHPSAFPKDTAGEKAIDFVVVGEGEITFLELLNALESGKTFAKVDGIMFKDGNNYIRTEPRSLIEDLDMLPFPARDLMPHDLYEPAPTKRVSSFKSTSLTSARGCPHRCNFCSANVVWTRRYRFRNPKNVVDEMEHCIKTFGIREFSFTDELFTLRSERTSALCEDILRRNLNVAWVCMCRAGQVSKDLLRLMKRAGCREISFGLESGDQDILNRMHKDITLEKALESVRLTQKAGIRTHASYMIGNLGENEKTIRKTIDFAKKLNTDIAAFFTTTPLPGTELYDNALQAGYIRKNVNWNNFSPLSKVNPVMSLPGLDSEALMRWHRCAIKEYYLRPRYILKKLFSLRTKGDFLNIYNGLRLFLRIGKNGK